MLKLKHDAEASAHPLQALCPWINPVTDGLVLNKDGSLLAAFEYQGVDPDDLTDDFADQVSERMQAAYASLDSRITAWWIVDKRRDYSYANSEFQNSTAEKLDGIYSKQFKSGKRYLLRYTFYMLFTGATGTAKFFDRVARIQGDDGAPLTKALMSAVKESLSGHAAFAKDVGLLRDNVTTFERIISGFTNSAPLKFFRLEHEEFSRALATLLNRASPVATHTKPRNAMLDAWAPQDYVAAGPDLIQFKGNTRTVYAAVLGVIKWPEYTSPMLFEELAKLDMEVTIVQIVRFLNATESTAAINEAVEYYNLTKVGVLNNAMARAFSYEPEENPGKVLLMDQCKEALADVGGRGVTYVYQNLSVFVYADSVPDLNRNVVTASQNLSAKRFGTVRERINTLPSFAAMLPGQWAMQSRYDLMSVANLADCTPLYTMSEGSRTHDYFSNLVYNRSVPSFTTFSNTYGGRAYFSPHVGQVGHMIVIAPTSGGKTVFVNFCLSQFQRYGHVHTIIFDRNYSCRIVTALHGGQNIDIKSGNVSMNPMSLMMDGSPDGKHWVREWILCRFKEGGYDATTEDRNELDKALDLVEDDHKTKGIALRLSMVAAYLPTHLEAELREWLEGHPYGMFDSEVDDFSISTWTNIEMKDILSKERLARAFMDYSFRKIYVQLDGTPTFIYLEEATFLLNDENFRDLIDGWLRTLRAKGAFLWMTIQSPQAITGKEISASILDNVFSFLLLHNKKVESHREAYKSNFALEDHHVDMIAKLLPKKDYLLIQNGSARVLRTDFTPEVLAYVRAEESIQKRFDKHEASGVPDWQQQYLAEVSAIPN